MIISTDIFEIEDEILMHGRHLVKINLFYRNSLAPYKHPTPLVTAFCYADEVKLSMDGMYNYFHREADMMFTVSDMNIKVAELNKLEGRNFCLKGKFLSWDSKVEEWLTPHGYVPFLGRWVD